MDYTIYDLGEKKKGEIVEVDLQGSAANLRLMDASNYQSFRNGGSHKYSGGLVKKSPIKLEISHTAHWYLTIDSQGLEGNVRSSVRTISNL